jgi:hypothetical protein
VAIRSALCPACHKDASFTFLKKQETYVCSECGEDFSLLPSAEAQPIEPQTIFLSYAHRSEREEDFDFSEELVLLIQKELQRDGHKVWIDKDGIRAGSQWREHITAAILEHTHFLSFLSTRSVRDPGVCLNEIAIALGHGKNIQTVLAQEEGRVAPPLTISHIQWHDFQDWREILDGTKAGPMGENWQTWFDQRMARLRETLSSAQNTRVSGDLQKLRDVLDPRSFEARIVEKTTNFRGRQWLFDAAQDWLDNSTSRMFWLKGSPGIGKSAFAAMLAHKTRSAVIGFFMCDFQGKKDPEESAREAICTLAFQIASRLPDYRLKLLYQMQVDKDKVNKRSADDLFEFLITEPLNQSGKIPESTRLCVVIDALDEAGRSDGRNALAELLVKHAERLPEWLGVLVTSRPEPYLQQMLKTLSGTAVDGQSAQNQHDLLDWIDQRLPKEIQGEDRQRVIEAVLEKSGGTFLYLSLIEKDKTLSLADPKNLPDKLDGFFKQTFNRYFPDRHEYERKTEPFLRLMAAAPGPLPTEMGRQILGWSQRELTLNVIEPMGSLLQERSDGLVFFHASLTDWLKDSRRSGAHHVEDSGAKELGEFVWRNFIKLFGVAPNVTNSSMFMDYAGVEAIEWMPQLVSWIAELSPHVSQWHSSVAISRLPRWLEFHGRYPEAIRMARRYLALITAEDRDPSDFVNAGYLLSDTLTIYEENFREAEDLARLTLDRARSLFGAESQEAARLAHTIGNILTLRGNKEDALPFFREALQTRERLLGWGHGATRLSLGRLSIALADLGRYGEAMALLVSALEASSHKLEENHPMNRWLQVRIGELQISEPSFSKTRH